MFIKRLDLQRRREQRNVIYFTKVFDTVSQAFLSPSWDINCLDKWTTIWVKKQLDSGSKGSNSHVVLQLEVSNKQSPILL